MVRGHWTFLNHVKITVRDFKRSKTFYSRLFRFLKIKTSFEVKERNSAWGGRVIGWGEGGSGFDLEIQEGDRKFTKQKFNRERIGLDHIAFDAPSKEAVDKFYKNFLLKDKIKCWSPRKYPEYVKGYYAVFFLDPDDIILEYAFLGK